MTNQPFQAPTADDFLMGGGAGKSAFGKNDPVGTQVTGVIQGTEVRVQTDIQSGETLTWDNGDPRLQLVITVATDQRLDHEDDGIRAFYVKGSKSPGSQSMHDAIRAAVQAAGAPSIEVGGTLTIQYAGTEPSKTRGFNDRKLWAAHYIIPDKAAAANDFLAVAQPLTTPDPWANAHPQPAWSMPPVAAPVVPAQPVYQQPAVQQVPQQYQAPQAPVAQQIPQQPQPIQQAPQPVAAPVAPTPAAAPTQDPAALARQLIAVGQDDATIAAYTGLDPAVVTALRAA